MSHTRVRYGDVCLETYQDVVPMAPGLSVRGLRSFYIDGNQVSEELYRKTTKELREALE